MYDVPFFDNRAENQIEKKLYGRHAHNVMKTDIKETDDNYELIVDLPGFKKDEIKVSLEDGYLTIEAVKYKNVAKGVSRTMGGKVLNYEAKDILNRGRAEGRREGEASGIRIGEERTKIQIATKLLNMGNDIKSVVELAELPQETVEKLAQSISKEEK